MSPSLSLSFGLVYAAIGVFACILLCQYMESSAGVGRREGMTSATDPDADATPPAYIPYANSSAMPVDPLSLAQQNATNIAYLKSKMDAAEAALPPQLQQLSSTVQTLQTQVAGMQTQVAGLAQAQQGYATQLTGGTPPTITGSTNADTDTVATASP